MMIFFPILAFGMSYFAINRSLASLESSPYKRHPLTNINSLLLLSLLTIWWILPPRYFYFLVPVLGVFLIFEKRQNPVILTSRLIALVLQLIGLGGIHILVHTSPEALTLWMQIFFLGTLGIVGLFPFCFTEHSTKINFIDVARDFWTKSAYLAAIIFLIQPIFNIPQFLNLLVLATLLYHLLLIVKEPFITRLFRSITEIYLWSLVLLMTIVPYFFELIWIQFFIFLALVSLFGIYLPSFQAIDSLTLFDLKGFWKACKSRTIGITFAFCALCGTFFSALFPTFMFWMKTADNSIPFPSLWPESLQETLADTSLLPLLAVNKIYWVLSVLILSALSVRFAIYLASARYPENSPLAIRPLSRMEKISATGLWIVVALAIFKMYFLS